MFCFSGHISLGKLKEKKQELNLIGFLILLH